MSQAHDETELRERIASLERQLDALQTELQRATNRDIPLLKGTVRSILDGEIETIEEFPAAGRAFGQQFTEQGERLDQLEARVDVLHSHTDASTKAEKFAAVLAFAQNKANGTGKAAVSPAEIRGCTGVSRRYAYDLVDALAADIDGVAVREPHQVQTGTGTKRKQKALLVDCEQVHEVCEAVKEFTTPNGGDDGP
jgi:tetrahydromethanopterin S-methyltransferase subunit G